MRRHRHEEHQNHEAWAIPYADLMTLLLAFFVVMYAVSVVNEGKFRVMSESLLQAFNGNSQTIAPPPASTDSRHPAAAVPIRRSANTSNPVTLPIPLHRPPTAGRAGSSDGKSLQDIENQVRSALQPLIDRKLVVVRHTPDWLEIEIRTDILFPSGVAQLSASANAVLQNLAGILARFPNALRVEGFTDNMPIATAQYPSNWELSAARAASVARLFATTGVAPDRLGIIGWGEVRPLADNDTAEGRNQNRRVLVVVMNDAAATPRQQRDAQQWRDLAGPATAPAAADPAPPAVAPTPRVAPGHLPVVPSVIAVEPHSPPLTEARLPASRSMSPDR
ncbi:flagellar motor protein MotD [Rhodanobacter lindaniclasticus]